MLPSIVFDFDGTLAVGHGPILAYARIVAPIAGADYLERVEAELQRYDAGESEYRDGYDIAASLAVADGVSAEVLQATYMGSRELVGTELAPVTTVPDIDGFLAALGAHARLVVATNAPERGIDRVLAAWGVRERFAEIHFTVGKPAGLEAVVARLAAEGPVLAIGDIAPFDLTPVQHLGVDTALVGATHKISPAQVTLRGESVAALRTEIEAWAATAASKTPASLGAGSSNER